MEVMPRRGLALEPAACAPAGARPQKVESTALDRADPQAIASSAACRACARLPRSASQAAFVPLGGFTVQTMQAPETTRVVYGVNELELDLAGKTVHGIWKALEQVFNIPRDAVITVNGSRTDDEYVVRPGDEIEFQKAAGVKGQAV
jgi:hypothetical protein